MMGSVCWKSSVEIVLRGRPKFVIKFVSAAQEIYRKSALSETGVTPKLFVIVPLITA
jgi:hypothetical protein